MTTPLSSFSDRLNAVVVGATGGIGSALLSQLQQDPSVRSVFALSKGQPDSLTEKAQWLPVNLEDEHTLASAAKVIRDAIAHIHLVVIATGFLHDGTAVQPEKTFRALDKEDLERLFLINSIGPALLAKHFLPLLPRKERSVFAALSARVGSISGNGLGGWYGYRASKAALNMLIKTLSVEAGRTHPSAVCVGLHPGTVDTKLSKPFTGSGAYDVVSPEASAANLLAVIDGLTPEHTGKVWDWQGQEVLP